MNPRYFAVLGAVLGALGVLLGAYHAHGLESWLEKTGVDPAETAQRMENAAIAVRYQMYHALALLLFGWLAASQPTRLWQTSCWLCTLGTLLFSGGLYLIVFSGSALHWAIVPVGGLTLIASWFAAALAILLGTKVKEKP